MRRTFLISVPVLLLSLLASLGCPDSAKRIRARLEAGEGLLEEGNPDQALIEFEEALALAPDDLAIHRRIGAAYAAKGDFDQAIAKFEFVLERDPRSAETHAQWGQALASRGDLPGAVARYRVAVTLIDVADGTAPGGEERASRVRILEASVRLAPGEIDFLYRLGRAYLEEGRYEEAHNLIRRATAATAPDDPSYRERARDLEAAALRLPRGAAAPDAPNLLLVVIDTLRPDHLGAYGYPRPTSPRLDAAAEAAVLFENAISQAPWTAASLASLFTGLYPSVHGLDSGPRWGPSERSAGGALEFGVQTVLSPSQVTLAEVLRRSGYRTAGFVSNTYANSIFGFAQGFEKYDDEHGDYGMSPESPKRRAHDTNRSVFEWLDAELEEPFFLFVHYNDPHWPYDPPAPFGQRWVSGYRGQLTPAETGAALDRKGEPITYLSPDDIRYVIGLYDGEIAYVDAQVGRLLDRVRSLELDREVWIAITSDHGEEFLDHGGGSHGFTLYDEQIRVPLLFLAPGRLEPSRIDAQVRLIDVPPTILEIAGVEVPPEGIQGRSLLPLMKGTTSESREAYSEATYHGNRKSLRTTDGRKVIYGLEDGEVDYFDLSADPKERTALEDPGDPRWSSLRDQLLGWVRSNRALRAVMLGDGAGVDEIVLDEETRMRLERLGYIE
jgi:arylsulfatase A-like enzyme/Flp pilus assembly protein TadD